MEVVKVNAKEQVADIGTKPMDKETLRRHMKTLGLISINMTSFKSPEVLVKVLAAMSVMPATEALEDYYYDDGVNINVSMTNEFSLWSCLSHLLVTIVAVAVSYYMFVVKAKQDGVGDKIWATPFRPVHDEVRSGPRVSPGSPSRRRGRDVSPESEVHTKKKMSVLVQGPVTYKSRSKDHSYADDGIPL